jgi:hypothetical protein
VGHKTSGRSYGPASRFARRYTMSSAGPSPPETRTVRSAPQPPAEPPLVGSARPRCSRTCGSIPTEAIVHLRCEIGKFVRRGQEGLWWCTLAETGVLTRPSADRIPVAREERRANIISTGQLPFSLWSGSSGVGRNVGVLGWINPDMT